MFRCTRDANDVMTSFHVALIQVSAIGQFSSLQDSRRLDKTAYLY